MSTVKLPIELSPDDRAALTMTPRHSFPDAEIDEAMLEAVALAGFLDESSGVRLDWDRYRGPLETHAAALEAEPRPRLVAAAADPGERAAAAAAALLQGPRHAQS